MNDKMEILKYTYEIIDSKMYIVMEEEAAIIIDPCMSNEAVTYLKNNNITEVKILLTHEHYDHFSGVELFRENFKCSILASKDCSKNLMSSLKNGSKYFAVLFMNRDKETLELAQKIKPVTLQVDDIFEDEINFDWKKHEVLIKETKGHSAGSVCIILDNKYVFTGDSLLKDERVIVTLAGGNEKNYENTEKFLKSLPKYIYVYPGHGESGFIDEFF